MERVKPTDILAGQDVGTKRAMSHYPAKRARLTTCMLVIFLGMLSAIGAADGWRVILEDNQFPTDDIIVAFCDVTDSPYGLPDNTVDNDCTEAFQAALDAASDTGGGTVFIPAGRYRIDGTLSIGDNVILRGRWRKLSADSIADGTVLCLYSKGADPIFLLNGNGAGVRDLTFWHPEQVVTKTSAVEYPFVIGGKSGNATIENITLVNASHGIDMSASSMCCLRGIYGSPLMLGLTADQSFAVSRYNEINFSPDYWAWSKLPGSPSLDGDHKDYIRANGTAVEIKEMDGFQLVFSDISGYWKGLRFTVGERGDNPWGSMASTSVTDCDYAVHFEDNKHIPMANCTIQGSVHALWVDTDAASARLNSCTIEGDINAAGKGVEMFSCTWTGDNVPGNNGTVTRRTLTPKAPAFNMDYDRIRKPLQTFLFNVKESPFNAVGDGIADDTAAIQAALAAAEEKDGGIVFVPNGKYLMTRNLALSPGVELRGSSGGRHIASAKNGRELGSLLLIGDFARDDADGEPFITLADYCGVRGINFHYQVQDFREFIPYPYMIQGNGVKNYIIDCFASNPYQAAEMNGDDHLVEYTFFGGLRSTYRANNCTGGRIQSCHVKPDFWRDIWLGGDPRSDLGLFKGNIGESLEVFYLKDCNDYSIMSIFNHASHNFFTADNSSGQTLLINGEQIQNGYKFLNGSKKFDLLMSGGNLNNIGDGTGTTGIGAASSFNGQARFFGVELAGTPTKTFDAQGGEIYVQQGTLASNSAHGAFGIFCGPGGTLTLDSSNYSRLFGFEHEGAVSMQDCSFSEGLVYSVAAPFLEDNNINGTYILADMNQNPIYEYGLEVLNPDSVEIREAMVFPGEYNAEDSDDNRKLNAARSMTGTFSLDVTEPAYSGGKNRSVTIELYLLMFENTKVSIYYDSMDGEKLGNSYTRTSGTKWVKTSFSVDDARFDDNDGVDIRVVVEEGTNNLPPLLNYVVVKSSLMPSDSPHTGEIVLNNNESGKGDTKTWTVSDLNQTNPPVTGSEATANGTVSLAGDLGASESFSLTATGVIGWATADAQAAASAGTMDSYLAGLAPGKVAGIGNGELGVDSRTEYPDDGGDTLGKGTPEALIYTVDTTNLVSGTLYLLDVGFQNYTLNDRTDFMIYDASENTVIKEQWKSKFSKTQLGNSIALDDGDKIIIGASVANGTNDYRVNTLTLDVFDSSNTNSKPSITSPATAESVNIKVSETANLHVAARDPDGDELTYTWRQISGLGTIEFTENGTLAADTTTATFSEAGIYGIRVTVSDGKQNAYSSVDIVVSDVGTGGEATVSFDGLADNARVTNDQDLIVKLTGSATGGIKSMSLSLDADWQAPNVISSSPFQWDLGILPPGEHTLLAILVPVVGTPVRDEITITVVQAANFQPEITEEATASPTALILGDHTTLSVGARDPDGNDSSLTYTWSQVSGPGTATFTTPNADTTTAGFPATGTYEIRVTVRDDSQIDVSSDITVRVLPIGSNLPPTADDAQVSTVQEEPVEIILTGSDPENAQVTFRVTVDPTNGSLGSVSGETLTYTPNAGFVGSDTFKYVSNDGEEESLAATVTVTVLAKGDTGDIAADDDGGCGGCSASQENPRTALLIVLLVFGLVLHRSFRRRIRS